MNYNIATAPTAQTCGDRRSKIAEKYLRKLEKWGAITAPDTAGNRHVISTGRLIRYTPLGFQIGSVKEGRPRWWHSSEVREHLNDQARP